MTREDMWEEFESQLIREVRTPITMSYDDSIRVAERGIKEVVKRWKKRLEQEQNIKSLGDELRIFRNSITDDKVLIGFNMAVAICNKHFAGSEVNHDTN